MRGGESLGGVNIADSLPCFCQNFFRKMLGMIHDFRFK